MQSDEEPLCRIFLRDFPQSLENPSFLGSPIRVNKYVRPSEDLRFGPQDALSFVRRVQSDDEGDRLPEMTGDFYLPGVAEF